MDSQCELGKRLHQALTELRAFAVQHLGMDAQAASTAIEGDGSRVVLTNHTPFDPFCHCLRTCRNTKVPVADDGLATSGFLAGHDIDAFLARVSWLQ